MIRYYGFEPTRRKAIDDLVQIARETYNTGESVYPIIAAYAPESKAENTEFKEGILFTFINHEATASDQL